MAAAQLGRSVSGYAVGRSPAWRHLTQLPQGRKAARVSGLCRVRGGPFPLLARFLRRSDGEMDGPVDERSSLDLVAVGPHN